MKAWFAVCPCGVKVRLPEAAVKAVARPVCMACHADMTYVQEDAAP